MVAASLVTLTSHLDPDHPKDFQSDSQLPGCENFAKSAVKFLSTSSRKRSLELAGNNNTFDDSDPALPDKSKWSWVSPGEIKTMTTPDGCDDKVTNLNENSGLQSALDWNTSGHNADCNGDLETGTQKSPSDSQEKSEVVTRTYLTRFWILGLFSIVALMQCTIWGTWGPIMESAKYAFPTWTSGTISLLPNWGPIDCILFVIPVSWFNQKYGLRAGLLLALGFMSVGTLMRCFSSKETAFTVLANLGAIFNGVGGCLTLSLPAMIASVWFPAKERTTATAVASLFSQLGGVTMYLSPLVVRAPPRTDEIVCTSLSVNEQNSTIRSPLQVIHDAALVNPHFESNKVATSPLQGMHRAVLSSAQNPFIESRSHVLDSFNEVLREGLISTTQEYDNTTDSADLPTPDDVRHDIMILMYIHAGIVVFLTICTLVYFPAKPAKPPSQSSNIERLHYFVGFKTIMRNSQMMLLVVTYIFSFGIPVVWIGVMNFSLCCIGIHQEESMYVAIVAVSASAVSSFIAARITDYIYGYLRVTIMALLFASSLCFLWFLLLSIGVIAPSLVQVYISVSGGIALEYATVPLLIELAVELSYPSPEGVVGAFLTFTFNIISFMFLLLFMIPSSCYMWVTYMLVGCTVLTIIPLFFIKEEYKRTVNDRTDIK